MSQWATGHWAAAIKQSFSEKKARSCTTYSHIAIKIILFFLPASVGRTCVKQKQLQQRYQVCEQEESVGRGKNEEI